MIRLFPGGTLEDIIHLNKYRKEGEMGMANTHPEYVARRKAAMLRAGLRQTELAAKWGCTKSMVSQLVLGQARSQDLEERFAKAVGRKHSYLFVPAAQLAAK